MDAVALKRSCGTWAPAALTCTLSLVTDFRNSRLFSACERKPSNSVWTLLGLYERSQMSLVLAAASVLQYPFHVLCSYTTLNLNHSLDSTGKKSFLVIDLSLERTNY